VGGRGARAPARNPKPKPCTLNPNPKQVGRVGVGGRGSRSSALVAEGSDVQRFLQLTDDTQDCDKTVPKP
jgi:hypothetical protein